MIAVILILSFVTLVYCITMLWVSIGFNSHLRFSVKKTVSNQVTISVVIPMRNESASILNCLNSLEKQSLDHNCFEVVVIDDNSSDNSLEIVQEFLQDSSLNLRVYSLENKETKKEALKLGIEKSNYNVIATTDADCVVTADWLQLIAANMVDNDMLLGPVSFHENNGFLANFQVLDMLAMQAIEFGTLSFNKATLNNAANLVYKRSIFQRVNGFDKHKTPSGDDVFLLEKFSLNKAKISSFLSRESIVLTEPQKKLKDFVNQRLRWASKTKYYKNKLLISLSALIFLQNLSCILIYALLPLVENYIQELTFLLLGKWLFDFILLLLAASFFERKRSLLYFIPVQLVYPFYVVFIWILSMLIGFKWKHREYK